MDIGSLKQIGQWFLEHGDDIISMMIAARRIGEEIAKSKPSKVELATEKVATLYWLGNDLIWIQDQAYRGSTPERILEGLHCAQQYINELGFAEDEKPVQDVDLLIQTFEKLKHITDFERLRNLYIELIERIETVKWYIHGVLSEEQPEFEKCRVQLL